MHILAHIKASKRYIFQVGARPRWSDQSEPGPIWTPLIDDIPYLPQSGAITAEAAVEIGKYLANGAKADGAAAAANQCLIMVDMIASTFEHGQAEA